MKYQTVFPVGGVEEKTLRNLAEQLSSVSGQRIDIAMQIVVSTEDVDLSSMLDTLRDKIAAGKPVKITHRKNGHNKPKPANDGMTSHTRRCVETGEINSTQALRKMIAGGQSILEGTLWEDIKGQRFVVIGGELVKEPKA